MTRSAKYVESHRMEPPKPRLIMLYFGYVLCEGFPEANRGATNKDYRICLWEMFLVGLFKGFNL